MSYVYLRHDFVRSVVSFVTNVMGQNHALQTSNCFSRLQIICFHGSRMVTALFERSSSEGPIPIQLNPVNISRYTLLTLSFSGLTKFALFSNSVLSLSLLPYMLRVKLHLPRLEHLNTLIINVCLPVKNDRLAGEE